MDLRQSLFIAKYRVDDEMRIINYKEKSSKFFFGKKESGCGTKICKKTEKISVKHKALLPLLDPTGQNGKEIRFQVFAANRHSIRAEIQKWRVAFPVSRFGRA
ncbi:MAG: hypothetical protein LBJ76_04705 [Candidatus Accumulibacter sp.]|jgi:hypothetical protein|nr:hypothetical protein [Accumulibacter sp.]